MRPNYHLPSVLIYWGPSAGRRWGSPPAGEGRGSPGRPGGLGRSRTGQWSRPWLLGTRLGPSAHLTTPWPLPPHGGHRRDPTALPRQGRGKQTGSCQRTRLPRPEAVRVRRTAPAPGPPRSQSRDHRLAWGPTSTWIFGAGISPVSAPPPRGGPFYSFWLLPRDDPVGCCPRRPLCHLTNLTDVLLLPRN